MTVQWLLCVLKTKSLSFLHMKIAKQAVHLHGDGRLLEGRNDDGVVHGHAASSAPATHGTAHATAAPTCTADCFWKCVIVHPFSVLDVGLQNGHHSSRWQGERSGCPVQG